MSILVSFLPRIANATRAKAHVILVPIRSMMSNTSSDLPLPCHDFAGPPFLKVFMNWPLLALQNTFSIQGRAQRKEYWYLVLFSMVGQFALELLAYASGMSVMLAVSRLFYLVMLVPGWTAAIRRMHDIGWSGWWLFVAWLAEAACLGMGIFCLAGWRSPMAGLVWLLGMFVLGIVVIVFLCQDSQPGDNKYGPNPKRR